MEHVLDSKVSLLGKALREEGSLANTLAYWAGQKQDKSASSGRRPRRSAAPEPLVKQGEMVFLARERQQKKLKQEAHRAQVDAKQGEIAHWEAKCIKQDELQCLRGMWEVPSLVLLMHSLSGYLRLNELTLTGLELGLLQPCHSHLMARVCSALLTVHQGNPCRPPPTLPYSGWHEKLVAIVAHWCAAAALPRWPPMPAAALRASRAAGAPRVRAWQAATRRGRRRRRRRRR